MVSMSLESADISAGPLLFASDLVPPRWDLSSGEIEVWRDNGGRVCAYGQIADGQPWMRVTGIGDFRLDPSGSSVAVPDEGVSRAEVIDTYYRAVLPMALQLAGREVLHASAVVLPQGVLALCARSETGKSTLAYGMSRRGHQLYADDAVAFDAQGPYPMVTRVPFALRLRQASAAHFGERSRDLVRVEVPRTGMAEEERPLAALCIVERLRDDQPENADGTAGCSSERPAVVERLSPADSFAAVLPHAYSFSLRDSERKRRMMRHYLTLVRRIPVLRLRFLSGLGHITEILETLERGVFESCSPAGEPVTVRGAGSR
jgi:hypothetical protein